MGAAGGGIWGEPPCALGNCGVMITFNVKCLYGFDTYPVYGLVVDVVISSQGWLAASRGACPRRDRLSPPLEGVD